VVVNVVVDLDGDGDVNVVATVDDPTSRFTSPSPST
jgi:hypothetical protein